MENFKILEKENQNNIFMFSGKEEIIRYFKENTIEKEMTVNLTIFNLSYLVY